MARLLLVLFSLLSFAAVHADSAVEGKIQLDPKLAKQAKPGDTLYVFARAAQGPRMPLAVMKAKVSDLPLNYRLDDSMAMNPGMRLSQFDRVVVVARVSPSGEPMAQKGDLEGASEPIAPGQGKVNVTINKVVP